MPQLDPLDLLKVHHTAVMEDGSEKIVKVTPYMVITIGDHPKLFLKNGVVWDAGGREVKQFPPGFWGAVANSDPARLKECGFDPEDVQNLNNAEDKPESTQSEPQRKRR